MIEKSEYEDGGDDTGNDEPAAAAAAADDDDDDNDDDDSSLMNTNMNVMTLGMKLPMTLGYVYVSGYLSILLLMHI